MNITTKKFINNLGHFRGYDLSINIDKSITMYRIQKYFNFVSIPKTKRDGYNFTPSFYNQEFINDEYQKFKKDNNLRTTNTTFEEKDGVVIATIRIRVWDNENFEEKSNRDLELLIDYIKEKIE
jgi:hypothetical protein